MRDCSGKKVQKYVQKNVQKDVKELMIGIEKEMLIFLSAFLTGLFLRIAYRCLECLRGLVKHSLTVIGIEDLFYWIFVELYVFVQIYHTSNGSVRWYYILGIVSGAALMSWIFGKVQKLCKRAD